MDDQNTQNTGEIVTIDEAISKVKAWTETKEFDKVKEGCDEILEVAPDNTEIKALLEEAEKALSGGGLTTPEVAPEPEVVKEVAEEPIAEPAPEVAPEPEVVKEIVEEPIAEPSPEVAPEPEVVKEIVEEPIAEPTPEVAPEPEVAEEPIAEPAPEVAPEPEVVEEKPEESVSDEIPADIFNKQTTSEPSNPTEDSSVEETPVQITPEVHNSSKAVIIIVTIGLIGIMAGAVYAYTQGLLNPIFEWILGTIGM